MEVSVNQPVRPSRGTIQQIVSRITDIVALTPYASKIATAHFKDRIVSQLERSLIRERAEVIDAVSNIINKREALAFIVEMMRVGSMAAEACSAKLAQLSQSAFKSTSQEVNLTEVVNKICAILCTIQDRSDQKVITHFDWSYAPEGNYSLRDIIDMRAIFVTTYISDFIENITIGVMEPYDDDQVRKKVRAARARLVDELLFKTIVCGHLE